MWKIRFLQFLCFVSLLLSAFLLPKATKAALVTSLEYSEIPSYSTGDLDGQNGWNSSATSSISTQDWYTGSQTIYFDNTNTTSGIITKSFATSTSGTQCVAVKYTDAPPGNEQIISVNSTAGTVAGYILLVGTDLYIKNGPSSNIDSGQNLTLDTWEYVCVVFNTNTDKTYYILNGATTTQYTITTGAMDYIYMQRGYQYLSNDVFSFTDAFSDNPDLSKSSTTVIIINPEFPQPNYEVVNPDLFTGDCVTEPCARLINNPKYCYYDLDVPCTLDFQYNDHYSPATLYIVPVNGFPADMEATFYLTDDNGGTSKDLEFVNPGIATTTYRQLWAEIPGYGGYRLGNYMVEWVAEADILDTSSVTAICNCDNVATSTGFFDEFRYGFECGSRMAACWLFTPSPGSTAYLIEEFNEAKESFPISFVYTIKNFTYDITQSTTSVSSGVELAGLTGNMASLNGLDILPLQNVSSSIAYPLVQSVRDILSVLIKIILFGYFIYRIFTLSGAGFTFFSKKKTEVDMQKI